MEIWELRLLLRQYPSLADFLINIFLVSAGVREACLIEGVHIGSKNRERSLLILKGIAIRNYLLWYDENIEYQRYLVTTPQGLSQYIKDPTEHTLGKLLGFFCHDHQEFYNHEKDRIGVSVNVGKINIIAEMCEMDKVDQNRLQLYYEQLVNRIRKVLPSNYRVTFKITEIISVTTRLTHLQFADRQYLIRYIEDYRNDIYNYWIKGSSLYRRLDEYSPELLSYFWEEFVLGDRVMRSKLGKLSPEKIPKILRKLDSIIFSDPRKATISKLEKEWQKLISDNKL